MEAIEMLPAYKERILNELEEIPNESLPIVYKIIHLIASKFILKQKKMERRNSLKGIWRGSQLDDSLFLKAKKSLFPYECQ